MAWQWPSQRRKRTIQDYFPAGSFGVSYEDVKDAAMALAEHKGPRVPWGKKDLQVGSTVDIVRIGPSVVGSIKRAQATERRVQRESIQAGLDYDPPKQLRWWERGVFNNNGPGAAPQPTAGRAGWYVYPILDAPMVEDMYKSLFYDPDAGPNNDISKVFGYVDWVTYQTHWKNFRLFPANMDIWVMNLKEDLPVPSPATQSEYSTSGDVFGPNPAMLVNNFTTQYDDNNPIQTEAKIDPLDYRNHPQENKVWSRYFYITEHRRFRIQPGEELKISTGVNRCKLDPVRDNIKQMLNGTNTEFTQRWIHRKWMGPVIMYKIWGDPVIDKDGGTEGAPQWDKPNMGAAELSYIDTGCYQYTPALSNDFYTNYEINRNAAGDPVAAANDIPTADQIMSAAIAPVSEVPYNT